MPAHSKMWGSINVGTHVIVFSRHRKCRYWGQVFSFCDNDKIEIKYSIDGHWHQKSVHIDEVRELNPNLFPVESKPEVEPEHCQIEPLMKGKGLSKEQMKELQRLIDNFVWQLHTARKASEEQMAEVLKELNELKEKLSAGAAERKASEEQIARLSAAAGALAATLAATALAGLWRLLTRR